MSDDEAFIRGIVANPGDDAPRLIYADWLEERGDARAEFVRAEVASARERTSSAEPCLPVSHEDWIWYARIARAPAGIVVDWLDDDEDSRIGSPVELRDINSLAERLQIAIPPEYVAFLLNYNGWSADRNYFTISSLPGMSNADIRRFLALQKPEKKTSLDIEWICKHIVISETGFAGVSIREYLPDYLPIATAYNGHHVLIGVNAEAMGKVALFSNYPNRSSGFHAVANSLGEFLAMLTDDSPIWVNLVAKRDAEGVMTWLDSGGDPNAYTGRSGSILECTIATDQWQVAGELIRRGANIPDYPSESVVPDHAPKWLKDLVDGRQA